MLAKYLYENLRWQLNKNPFEHLLCAPTTKAQYFEQLERIANGYPLQRRVSAIETEFCLNRLALAAPRNEAERTALGYFGYFWAQYVRLKRVFGKKYMLFPADSTATRIEEIAELLCKCTQFALSEQCLETLVRQTCETVPLTEREERYLGDVVRLYQIKHYCAALTALRNKPFAEKYLAKQLCPTLLQFPFAQNTKHCLTTYSAGQIAASVDCLGGSATRLGTHPTHTDVQLYIYADGRNVFDTFVQSKLGQRQAEFCSSTKSVQVQMRYFLHNNCEVRNCTVTNRSKRMRKLTVELPFAHTAREDHSYFKMGNALCIASDIFAALAVVKDNRLLECRGERAQIFDITVPSGGSCNFDIVTIYADDSAAIAETLDSLQRFGATRCPFFWDSACARIASDGTPLILQPNGHTPLTARQPCVRQLNFSYQLGNSDVATFADKLGNNTTLAGGFVFGVGGEGVYKVQNGMLSKLNSQHFALDGDSLVFERGGQLRIRHDGCKHYDITYAKPAQTLFYFPLERKAAVTLDRASNSFALDDGERRLVFRCRGRIESYTTNALECSEDRLRYKLSGDLDAGHCLAICLARDTEAGLDLISKRQTPAPTPIIRESLVSTYLNYINDKNVFCLSNMLKRADSLTLTAICYTNPQFVKNYLLAAAQNAQTEWVYDADGVRRPFADRLAAPLAAVYYLNLVGELPQNVLQLAQRELFAEAQGRDICIAALGLLRAARLKGFDKVQCLVRYANLKKTIESDATLYAFAQAIGAVPLVNPSKQRLKDICNKCNVPKCWYYVSQLENLYGLSISAGKLQIQPKVSADTLEQFALNIGGKRIDTSFLAASVQCMTLNGRQCFAPFYAPSLKNEQNELVVSC